MGLTENLIEINNEAVSLLQFANGITSESDTTLGDAVLRLAEGFGTGEGGGIGEYTEVSMIPAGRSFSIPCDYDKCVIVLMLESSTNLYGGMGYNGVAKNAGAIQWTNDGTGFSMIFIDNINLRFSSMGTNNASSTTRKSEVVALSERARNIQPHWINSQTPVTGGYYVIPLTH